MENKQKKTFPRYKYIMPFAPNCPFFGHFHVIRHRRMQNIPKIWRIGG